MRTSGFAKSSSTAQFSYVNYLPVSGLCKALGNTQMRLPIVSKFIIYMKSFSTWLIQNAQWHSSFTKCQAILPFWLRRWKNSEGHLPAVTQCLAASSLPFCPNPGSHPHIFVHLGFCPGGTQSIPSYALDCGLHHSPHLVSEPLTPCVFQDLYITNIVGADLGLGCPVWVCLT